MPEWLQNITSQFTVEELYVLGTRAVIWFAQVFFVLLVAWVAAKLLRRSLRALQERLIAIMSQRADGPTVELEKRATTISGIITRTAIIAIWVVAVMMALKQSGFDIAPILAGAGVIGLAVGFGAQNLVRDVITGLFMLLENQIRVNDVAVINGAGGVVEEINLRTTVLRGLDGVVHVFPNGTITSLSNMTFGFSFYVFDLGVAYKEDTDRVVEVLREIAEELRQEPDWQASILEPLEVLGVDKFADSAVVIKSRIKTLPVHQWKVGREMNRRIKKKFDEVGIEIPFPHQSLYFGEASKPIKLELDGAGREQIKDVVREVLREQGQRPA